MRFFLFLISALQLLRYANEGLLTGPRFSLLSEKENNNPTALKRTNISIAIIGAGFAGLSAFRQLNELGFNNGVHLFEASQRVGGRVYPLPFEGIFLQQGAEFINGRDNPIYEMANRFRLITGEVNDGALISGEDAIFGSPPGCRVSTEKMEIFSTFTEELELKYAKMANASSHLWNVTIAELFEQDYTKFLERENAKNGESKGHFDSLARMYQSYYEGEWSAPIERLALHNYAQWKEGSNSNSQPSFPFASFTLNAQGYAPILEELSRGIPPEKLHLGSRIVNIDFRESKIRLTLQSGRNDNSASTAYEEEWPNHFDFVIVTLPIGHLKRFSSSLFTPPLPPKKLKAIQSIGFGAMQKVFLVYDRPFWNANSTNSIVTLSCPQGSPADSLEKNLHTFQPHPWAPKKILVAWLSGNGPKLVNELDENQLAILFTEHFRKMFPKMKEIELPKKIIRTKWLEDDLFCGSYSFITPEASKLSADPFLLLAAPIYEGEELRVMFAGEGTHSKMFQTTIGAMMSGRREAKRLDEYFAFNEENIKCSQ